MKAIVEHFEGDDKQDEWEFETIEEAIDEAYKECVRMADRPSDVEIQSNEAVTKYICGENRMVVTAYLS